VELSLVGGPWNNSCFSSNFLISHLINSRPESKLDFLPATGPHASECSVSPHSQAEATKLKMSQYISINFNLAGGTRPVAVALWRAYKIISQSLLTNRCTTTPAAPLLLSFAIIL
jgi:hypothetical protein